LPADRVKKTVVELTRTLVDRNLQKKKRRDLIGFLETMVAAASARGTIAEK
jgi:hypothetical protein